MCPVDTCTGDKPECFCVSGGVLWEAPVFDVCLWDLLTIREIKAKAQRLCYGGRTCIMSLTWIQSVTEQFRDVSAGTADYCNYSFCSAVLGA